MRGFEESNLRVGVGRKAFDWSGKSVEGRRRLHNGETIAGAKDGWFADSGSDLVVLDPKKYAHPERYIALAACQKTFESRTQSAE